MVHKNVMRERRRREGGDARTDGDDRGCYFDAGERKEGRPRVSDSLTTPIVCTSTYHFKDTEELIAYQEGTIWEL